MRRTKGSLVQLLALAALVFQTSVGLAVDQADLKDVLDGSTNMSATDRSRIETLFEDAAQAGLPRNALMTRLEEGLAKGVNPHRIVVVLQAELDYLERARAVLGDEAAPVILDNQANWERAANLLKAGWPDSLLKTLATACLSRPDSFRAAGSLYVALTEWGVDGESALLVVSAALDASLAPDDFPVLASLLARARDSRVPTAEAARRLVTALGEGKSLRQLEREFNRR